MVTALRVHVPYWLEDGPLHQLLNWLGKHPGTFDELAFFTSETHPPLPLPVMLARARRLRPVLAQARRAGYRAGINLLATMGHHEENLPGSLAEPWQRLVDPHGRECRGSFCPEDPGFLGYVRAVYQALARARPDFIWIDDDVRLMGHMPIGATCFCERCLEQFGRQVGRPVGREQLAQAVEGPAAVEGLALRRAWLEHNRQTIDRLFRVIEETVHAVRTDLPLGFMTGDRYYEGYAFRRWAQTLAGPQGVSVRWRPGGGFYSDEAPIGLVGKAHDIGRQAAALPPAVEVVQSELENFPYHLLRKSAHTTVTESAAHMAAGASGVAFNILPGHPSRLGEMSPLLERVAASRPYYDRLHAELGRSPALGIWPAWNEDTWAAGGELGAPYALAEIGLPICYAREGAAVVALAGRMPHAFPRQELEAMLAGGVLLDVPALEALWELGLGEWCGVKPGAAYPVDTLERFADHPCNDPRAGLLRDCRQSFWPQPARALEPAAPGVEVLSRLTDYLGSDRGAALTCYQNPAGGRVAVAGYYPWSMITSAPKVAQYRALAQWLGGGRLPAVVETLAKAVVWVRAGAGGRRAAVLINASLDAQPALALRLRMPPGQVEHVPMAGKAGWLETEQAGDGCRRVTLHQVAPWSVHLLLYPRSQCPLEAP